MKIKMRTLSAGPNGVLEPGKVYDLDTKQALALIDGRYAVEAKADEAKKVQEIEKAEAPEGERADLAANRKKR